jgi:hypothetical protein
MSEGEKFTPPASLYLTGEGLNRMDQEAYERFVSFLGQQGIEVQIPEAQPPDNRVEEDEREVRQLNLLSLDEVRDFAREQGRDMSLVTRGLTACRYNGKYFPDSQEGILNSTQYLGSVPLFYYPNPLTHPPRILQSVIEAIDLTQGISHNGNGFHWKTPEGEAIYSLLDRASVDIEGLRELVSRQSLSHLRNVGPGTIAELRAALQNIPPDAGRPRA